MSESKRPPPPNFDDDAPELTDEMIRQMRPAREWFADRGIPIPKPAGRHNDVLAREARKKTG